MDEINDLIEKYWGKHSLFSIINYEKQKKNKDFIYKNVNKNVLNVINGLKAVSVVGIQSKEITQSHICSKKGWIKKLDKGRIIKANKKYLDKMENVLKSFYTQAYSDIKDVYYKKNEGEDYIVYELYFKKMIAGVLTDVPVSKESRGTLKILKNMTALLAAIDGGTVVIDEIDEGIHDILMKNIIRSLLNEIDGQLIVTTHNTLVLEEIDAKSAYVIVSDYLGNKQANYFADYTRVQKTNNLRELYNKGTFGGIPYDNDIDFNEIKTDL